MRFGRSVGRSADWFQCRQTDRQTDINARHTYIDRQTDRQSARKIGAHTYLSARQKARKSDRKFQNAHPPVDFQITLPDRTFARNGGITQKFSIFDKKYKWEEKRQLR